MVVEGPSHQDALNSFNDLAKKLERSIEALKNPTEFEAQPDQDSFASLFAMADCVSADATKFTLVFMGSSPPVGDAISLSLHVSKTIDKFNAWCSAVSRLCPAFNREVELLAEPILTALKNVVVRVVALNLQREPEPQLVGQVMSTVEDLKKMPTTESAAILRQLLRDAASLKSVVSDVEEMVRANDQGDEEPSDVISSTDRAADRLQQLDVSGEQEIDDLMNMDVALSPRGLQVARAALTMVKSGMPALKAAIRALSASASPTGPQGDAATSPAPGELEALARASAAVVRGAEDLGALAVLDQDACRPAAQQLVAGLEAVVVAAERLGATKAALSDAQAALREALEALQALP